MSALFSKREDFDNRGEVRKTLLFWQKRFRVLKHMIRRKTGKQKKPG